jgi:hypothetical protein
MTETNQAATKVDVFVNRRKLELHQDQMTGAQLLESADFHGDSWDLFKLHGEGDPTGGQLIQANELLHLKNGERFRVIPGHRTFGAA